MRHFLALLLCCVCGLAQAGEGFTLFGPPATGSNLRRMIVSNHPVPFDKAYAELTPEQQQWVRNQYKELGPNDVPPFPRAGLAELYRAAALVADRIDSGGYLYLVARVNAEGKAEEIEVYNTPDTLVSRYVGMAMLLEKYTPARCNGVPCAMEFPFRLNVSRSGLYPNVL
ncbi:hypothetical protein [Massilia sp. TS11]|uniref:hypothetical protein n=1 Tax=Massilia sp. TS11 TaxID=2908003 RepID=UPI001EDA9767|nr:hypothetical protein [Massilia sp. TS11]MCG2585368.1 hypothetical protein [Massilia sp. TS11]